MWILHTLPAVTVEQKNYFTFYTLNNSDLSFSLILGSQQLFQTSWYECSHKLIQNKYLININTKKDNKYLVRKPDEPGLLVVSKHSIFWIH